MVFVFIQRSPACVIITAEGVSMYDAILLVSFGGPEGPDDVMPFLRNVVRGRDVPDERLQEVAQHYYHFGGISPINEQNRELLDHLTAALVNSSVKLPVYWGNRNWHPLLEGTVRQMQKDGVRKALAIATSAYSSYSGCRQYIEDIDRATAAVGDDTLTIDKLPPYGTQPQFIEANAEQLKKALAEFSDPSAVHVAFTAHSVPMAMASRCAYADELNMVASTIAADCGVADYKLVYQSRSGPTSQAWLEPDICDYIKSLNDSGVKELVISPIGFISDHMEVLFDLDTEARHLCDSLGMHMVRARTVGTDAKFINLLRELIVARIDGPDPGAPCPQDCCPSGRPAGATSQRQMRS